MINSPPVLIGPVNSILVDVRKALDNITEELLSTNVHTSIYGMGSAAPMCGQALYSMEHKCEETIQSAVYNIY